MALLFDQRRFAALVYMLDWVPLSHRLLQRIRRNGNLVELREVDPDDVRTDGGASAGLSDPNHDVRRRVVGFAPQECLQTMQFTDHLTDISRAQLWESYIHDQGGANRELTRVINSSGLGRSDICRQISAPSLYAQVNLTVPELESYEQGAQIPQEILWRLMWLLRDWLAPGIGANVVIKVSRDFVDESHSWKQYFGSFVAPPFHWYVPKSIGYWDNVTGLVTWSETNSESVIGWTQGATVLFHELVHALHMIEGTRMVGGGWEEEAMTVGLYPFTNEEFTENRLRQSIGLALATSHQTPTVSSTIMTIARMDNTDRALVALFPNA